MSGAHAPGTQDLSDAEWSMIMGDSSQDRKPKFPTTDLGNGERFAYRFKGEFMYNWADKNWYLYDGTRWVADEIQGVMRRAKETVRSIYDEAKAEEDPDRRASLSKHAYDSEKLPRMQAMVKMAESELPVRMDDFDRDPMVLNCKNGTVNLRTGELAPHRKDDLITKMAAVEYDPEATCPTWDAFIRTALDDDEERIGLLQRFFGYCMTGVTNEHKLLTIYGTGANGKSVCTNTLYQILGDYSKHVQIEAFMKQNGSNSNQNYDLASLSGARLVMTTEVESGSRLAESLVKQLTGGDPVTARHPYGHPFTYSPQFKLCMVGNYKPVIMGGDGGIWRRIMLLLFNHVVPVEEQDKDLPRKLEAEYSGILNWMIEGCLQWQNSGLNPPESVIDDTNDYREEMDVLQRFIDEKCVIDPNAACWTTELFASYKLWTEMNKERTLPQGQFTQNLFQRGYKKGRGPLPAKRTVWLGIKLAREDYDTRTNFDGDFQTFSDEGNPEKVANFHRPATSNVYGYSTEMEENDPF